MVVTEQAFTESGEGDWVTIATMPVVVAVRGDLSSGFVAVEVSYDDEDTYGVQGKITESEPDDLLFNYLPVGSKIRGVCHQANTPDFVLQIVQPD